MMRGSRVVAPTTVTGAAIYATLRRALIEARTPSGGSLRDLLGADRVYIATVPNDPAFPYVTLRLARESEGANGFRERGSLEVQIVGRPASQSALVEDVADLVDLAFLGYTESGSGLMFGRSRTRQTLPAFSEPADRDTVGVVAVYSLTLWPLVLQDRAANAGDA